MSVVRRLKDRVRPEIKNHWELHHDNAPVHASNVVTETLAKFNMATLPHTPYNPDLAPSDFFLFLRAKRDVKGKRFDSIEVVQKASTSILGSIPLEDFQKAYDQWKKRWQRCIHAQEFYFEMINKFLVL